MKRILFSLALLLPLFVHAQIISTVAGNGIMGYSGDHGPATAAEINEPVGVVADKAGNIYFTEMTSNRVRKVDTAGIITTIAGTGANAHSGDNGPATAADVSGPSGIAVDTAGNIFFTEFIGLTVRKISTTGTITTVAGGGSTYANGVAATATILYNPVSLAVDRANNIYIDDHQMNVIRKINTSGIISLFAGIADSAGFSGDGGPATAAKMSDPIGIATDTAGNVYIVDGIDNNRVRKVDTAGIITTIAGNGIAGFSGDSGPATAAKLNAPYGVSVASNGNIFIADLNNRRIRVVYPSGMITTYAGNGSLGYSGDGGPATAANISPEGVFADNQNNVYIPDGGNQRIRKITPPAITTLLPDISVNNGISIYPNPATTALNISATGKINSVTISDLPGQVILSNKYDAGRVQIDIAQLPAGVYFVRVNGTEVRKFVKE